MCAMGNGIYYSVEPYEGDASEEERLYTESRLKLDNLKSYQRQLHLLMRQRAHYKTNPLCGPMCKDVEKRIYQLTLLLDRFHHELSDMVDQFNRMQEAKNKTAFSSDSSPSPTPPEKPSYQAGWEELTKMAKAPISSMMDPFQSKPTSWSNGGNNNDILFKSIYQPPQPSNSNSGDSSTTKRENSSHSSKSSQKVFPQQMTPPIEELRELRDKVKQIEQSPLFTAEPPAHIKSNKFSFICRMSKSGSRDFRNYTTTATTTPKSLPS